MPLCNTGYPYKYYTNCNIIAGKQNCDINRDCFPGSNITSVQSTIEVPFFISQGNDIGVNGVSADEINKISSCQPQSTANIQSAYCIDDSQDLGYQKCDFSVTQSAKCATCTRPKISGVPLNSNSVSSIGHKCTSTTDSLFYCDNSAYNACLSQSQGNSNNQPDIIFNAQQTDIIKICDISSISPNANTRIAKSSINSQLPLSICSVERSCVYNEYKKPSPLTDTKISQLTLDVSQKTIVTEACKKTYDWKNGLIYQLVTMFTSSLSIIIVFYIAIILYIMIRGLSILMSTETVSMQELSKQIISVALVLMFFSPTSWNYYQRFIELFV